MPSPEQKQQVKDIQVAEQQRKAMYTAAHPALGDLSAWLTGHHDEAMNLAELAINNATERSNHLQNALAYAKVKKHIEDSLS